MNACRENIQRFRQRYSNTLYFYVNNDEYLLENVSPRTLLADWLRQNGYTGTKIGCGQGGCGACTVMLTSWDAGTRKVVKRAVNACMRPLCAVDGMVVTTIEGIGNTRDGLNPIQHNMAVYDGTQCGYCTPGFVMNMYALQQDNPTPTQEDIENRFDGNLCRCTGYRPILYAMRRLGQNPPPPDQLTCVPADQMNPPAQGLTAQEGAPSFPEALKARSAVPLAFEGDDVQWFRPATLDEVYALKAQYADVTGGVKLVVGNTSIGIYPDAPGVYIDVSQIEAMNFVYNTGGWMLFGASLTITRLMQELDTQIAVQPLERTIGFRAMRQHLQRLANYMVRDAGSIAGNLMLVKNHQQEGTGEPFPSDLFLLIATLGGTVTVGSKSFPQGSVTYNILDMPLWSSFPVDAVILQIALPFSQAGDQCFTYKVARREQNAHAIVNGGFYFRMNGLTIGSARAIFGGLMRAPFNMTPLTDTLAGRNLDDTTLSLAIDVLSSALSQTPLYPNDEGFTDAYRRELGLTLFYKAYVATALAVAPHEVAPANVSAGARYVRPLSSGQQHITIYQDELPISAPVMKLGAFLQTTGEAKYTQDAPTPIGGYEAYFVFSQRAHANFGYRVPLAQMEQELRSRFPSFRTYVTAQDIPAGGTNAIGFGGDDLIFAVDTVNSFGQQIGLVVATNARDAKLIANVIHDEYLTYQDLPAILTIADAISQGSIFPEKPPYVTHIQVVERMGSNVQWLDNPTYPLNAGDLLITGKQASGSQAHFYMEPQISLVIPVESNAMLIYSSTQDAATVQHYVASVLNMPNHSITVHVKRLGGGFGGKETRPPMLACAGAVAAYKLNRPVRVAFDREADMWTIGKRHDLLGNYALSVSPQGRISGWKTDFYSDGGMTYDVSFPVMDLILLSADNAYMVATFRAHGEACKTNKASNTAMRSFGVIQMALVVEEAVEKAAYSLGMLAEDLRERNFYLPNTAPPYQTTPYNAPLQDCLVQDVWHTLRQGCDFDARLQAVREFNAANRWRKRGISLMPLKYGVSYTAVLLDQGGALLNVYEADGTVLLHHGGVEMGQGIHTKMAQLVSYQLNIPMKLVRVAGTDTNVVPNTSSTGASTGTDLNGGAVITACETLRKRLEDFALSLRDSYGEAWCVQNGVNFWDYPSGWNTVVTVNDAQTLIWNNIVAQAYVNRIDLSVESFFKYPYITDVTDTHPYGIPFFYYNYAAACSEVEIDVLTGEFTILRTDILYDAGESLNPCVDVGQIEGGFVQGIGYVTTEEVVFNAQGQLVTDNTWTYKPPDSKTIPVDFRVALRNSTRYNTHSGEEVSPTSGIKSSKTTGEPPLVLANTVFFAIKRAIMAAREAQGVYGWFEMDAPATVQTIQTLCAVNPNTMRLGNAIVAAGDAGTGKKKASKKPSKASKKDKK